MQIARQPLISIPEVNHSQPVVDVSLSSLLSDNLRNDMQVNTAMEQLRACIGDGSNRCICSQLWMRFPASIVSLSHQRPAAHLHNQDLKSTAAPRRTWFRPQPCQMALCANERMTQLFRTFGSLFMQEGRDAV